MGYAQVQAQLSSSPLDALEAQALPIRSPVAVAQQHSLFVLLSFLFL
jgi:hypothetical protein